MGLQVSAVTKSATIHSQFRKVLRFAMAPANFKDSILLVSYHRKLTGQPGAGHWSPVAAFAPLSDRVLIMDVARYKWPPHWVRTADLLRAMDTMDGCCVKNCTQDP